MFRFTAIRRAAPLAATCVLLFLVAIPSQARELRGEERSRPQESLAEAALRAIPDAWNAFLRAVWDQEGSSLDPFGNPKPDEGSSLDPFGDPRQ
ncbi:MAG: hypothetical protein ABUT39_30690 [Acidobacteriota bacterium]